VLLHQVVRTGEGADGAVEVDKCGVTVCFGVVEDALDPCIFVLQI